MVEERERVVLIGLGGTMLAFICMLVGGLVCDMTVDQLFDALVVGNALISPSWIGIAWITARS